MCIRDRIITELGGTPQAKIETPVVKSTKENLAAAIKGETYESQTMYAAFLEQAKKEHVKSAIGALMGAKAAEAVHAGLYQGALKNLAAWKGGKKTFYVCPICGNVMDSIAGPVCPICMASSKTFLSVT